MSDWDQPSFDDLPDPDEDRKGAARRDGSETMHEGARAIFPRSGTLRRLVLDLVAGVDPQGLTDFEVYARGLTFTKTRDVAVLRARRWELVNDGWLMDSGRVRPSPAGGSATVWVLTERGRTEYRVSA